MPDPPRYLQRLLRKLRRDLEDLRLDEQRNARVADIGELYERVQACRRMHFAASTSGRNLAFAGRRPPDSMVRAFWDDMSRRIRDIRPADCVAVWTSMMEFVTARHDERYLRKLIATIDRARLAAEEELERALREREAEAGHM